MLIFRRSGFEIDYMTFGGIYREVSLRIVAPIYFDNLHAQPKDVLTDHPSLDVTCFLAGQPTTSQHSLDVALLDGGKSHRAWIQPSQPCRAGGPERRNGSNGGSGGIREYRDHKRPSGPRGIAQESSRDWNYGIFTPQGSTRYVYVCWKTAFSWMKICGRIGFREAMFTDLGFSINGKIVKLRGLDRHQTFPFVGQAMPVACTTSRCRHFAHRDALQYRTHIALSAITSLLGPLR